MKEKKRFPKNMAAGLRELYRSSSLAAKIRYSYLILLVPLLVFLLFMIWNFWDGNRRYEDMINSVVAASEFSLDFQEDFDYETYLLIVGNKTAEESLLPKMLTDAENVVSRLESMTDNPENRARLTSSKKYIRNLRNYIDRIGENLKEGNRYEDNIRIWENDVQIVTSLLKESVFEYIYYELRDLQEARNMYHEVFLKLAVGTVVVLAVLAVLLLVLSYVIPKSITSPIRQLEKVTEQVAGGDFSVRSKVDTADEVRNLSDSMNFMIDQINDLLEQVKTEQVRLRKAEFRILQSQINPHFLYNTLDAIVWLAESGDQETVVRMVGSLSDFFRASLNQGKDIVTVREELTHVRSYLEIQQIRYQDIMEYEISVPEELHDYLIPKITIQPLVENALYHGVKNKRGVGHIRICGIPGGDIFEIRVEDDGIGMSEERLKQVADGIQNKAPGESEIYGLYNVNERLRLNFGERSGISVTSTDGEGTAVTVTLPCTLTLPETVQPE